MLKVSWPGNNSFWCKGKYLKGTDWYKTLITVFAILLSSFSVAYFSCSYWTLRGIYWPTLLILSLSTLSIIFLFKTSTSDPGYIPKQVIPWATHYAQNLNEHISNVKPLSFNCRGYLVKLKFCSTCMVYRPPRCSHCSVCNLCVEGFDHHCPWIGNCIGKRNYFYFIYFIFTTCLLCSASLVLCSFHIFKLNGEQWATESIFSVVNLVLGGILAVFIYCLLIFHVYLTVSGLTTNEKIKNLWAKSGNPFDSGKGLRNVKMKYLEFRTRPQFDINARVSVYDEEIDANGLHRGFLVSRNNSHMNEDHGTTMMVVKGDEEEKKKIDCGEDQR